MDTVSIYIPWPPRALSPNSRDHWRKRQAARRDQRSTAKLLAMAAMGRAAPPQWPAAEVMVDAIPPQRRRRDRDNLIASLKGALDGLADAGVVVDDEAFASPQVEFQEPSKKTPGVWITVYPPIAEDGGGEEA